MSIEITTPHDRTIEVSAHRELYITNTRTGQLINAALSPDEAKKVADALDPDRDFSGVNWKTMYEHGIRNRIAAVARLAAERDQLQGRVRYLEKMDAAKEARLAYLTRNRESEVDALRENYDERARKANARADAAEAKVRELREQVQRSGSIVYTVEEQDIEAEGKKVEVVDTGRQFNIRIQGQPVNAIKSSTEAREKAQRHIEAAARCEAIARRIETDTAVDPVEEKTDALADILYGHEMVTDQMRGVLERVVRARMLFPEQEASSDE